MRLSDEELLTVAETFRAIRKLLCQLRPPRREYSVGGLIQSQVMQFVGVAIKIEKLLAPGLAEPDVFAMAVGEKVHAIFIAVLPGVFAVQVLAP